MHGYINTFGTPYHSLIPYTGQYTALLFSEMRLLKSTLSCTVAGGRISESLLYIL